MKIKRYVRSSLFVVVAALLVVSIGISVFGIVTVNKKNKEIENKNAQIETTSQQLSEANQKLQQETEAKDKLSKELEQAQKENENLKNENENYKKEIAKLSAQKKAEVDRLTAMQNSPQSQYPEATKTCYLTFDDGPSNNTLKILEILRQYDAKATFFVIGTAKLEYLPQIVSEGHAIGLHSNTHKYSEIYRSTDAFFNDIYTLSQNIENIIGIKTKLMRFPGGSNNTVSRKYCSGIMTELTTQVQIQGYAYFDWNVSSGDADGHNVPASRIAQNVLNQASNKNSICVLMHDTAAKKTTVEALPTILDGLKKQGYKFEVLTEQTYGYHYKVNN